jgi:molybdopterin-guanine dinucleotide biosynthesis protein A
MVQDNNLPRFAENSKNQNGVLIKFLLPIKLKRALEELAAERNITLSALLRLISSEYVKRSTQA